MKVAWPVNTLAGAALCPVCGAVGPHAVLLQTTAPDATLLRCGTCTALAFQDAVPPDYGQDAVSEVSLQLYVEQNAGLFHMTRFFWQLDPVAHPIASLLDAGCGFGFPVDAARRVLGWRAAGIDPSFYADRGRELLGADLRREYLTNESDLGTPYDLVVATEVIEHIPNLYPFLATLRRWMVPGGVLMMTTPDAGSITPSLNESMLGPILTVGAHLVLFTAQAMEHALRQAGFAHVLCRVEAPTLFVIASDRPIVLRADSETAHAAGYTAYLRHILDDTEPGAALWNGAAGRLLEQIAPNGPLDDALALYARVATVWRDRFDIDLLRHRLPPVRTEPELGGTGPALVEQLRAEAPLNLGFVLYWRSVIEQRLPTSTPERIMHHARPAMVHAGQAYRALSAFGLGDFSLYSAAWNARIAILDAMIALAPELEPSLLAAFAAPSPGALAATIDPPRDAVIRRIASPFTRLVHTVAYDEATRLVPALHDLDAVCAALGAQPMVLFHVLFCIGVLHLTHLADAAIAHVAFARLRAEAVTRLEDPSPDVATHFLAVADEHLLLAPPPTRIRRRRA